jgi:hypothetical protein
MSTCAYNGFEVTDEKGKPLLRGKWKFIVGKKPGKATLSFDLKSVRATIKAQREAHTVKVKTPCLVLEEAIRQCLLVKLP